MSDKISISFDEDNKIRVLEADKFKETDMMRSESMEFMKSNFYFLYKRVDLI
jgi:intraflagellar transport protein 20